VACFEFTISLTKQAVPPVKDYQAALEKLRTEAVEARLVCDLATDPAKREIFDRLALHLTSLADQVELAMIQAAKAKRAYNPMSTNEEYRKQAAEAQKQAELSKTDHDREAWLRIAQSWLGLLRRSRQSEEEVFEARSAAEKTSDQDSDTSH
jgi:hypothetical protein